VPDRKIALLSFASEYVQLTWLIFSESSRSSHVVELPMSTLPPPVALVVPHSDTKIGSLLAEGDLLTTLTDTREVFVYFISAAKERNPAAARALIERL
jgi:hypothetical protein